MKLDQQLLESIWQHTGAPKAFPYWAMAKPWELNAPRKRSLLTDGTVRWCVGKEPGAVSDHLELSGLAASSILSYGKTRGGRLRLMKHLVVPGMRTLPDVTQSSFSYHFYEHALSLRIGKKAVNEALQMASIRGMLRLVSKTSVGLRVTRAFYPGVQVPALLEEVSIKNTGHTTVRLNLIPSGEGGVLPADRCKNGPFAAVSGSAGEDGMFSSECVYEPEEVLLRPGETKICYSAYYAKRGNEPLSFSIKEEIDCRKAFIGEMFCSLILETPLPELNAQFSHCVLRGSESIFSTPHGLMHSPGGGGYYAALWTNDQCEYANPFFPFSGYGPGLEQAVNGYRLYGNYMDRSARPMKEKAPLITSIISGGEGCWNGAGDRGDASMYAYGLGRFLLELSDEDILRELYDNLVWAIRFALSRKNKHGVIDSDSDELENRFPSGSCNLFTSCTTYDALYSGAALAEHLGDSHHAGLWRREREALGLAIERYFGCCVEGFETYRYYEGNTSLRAWICMPLTVGIFARAPETLRALFSKKLYHNGLLRTDSRSRTTWDRSLLFAIRGAFLSGAGELGMSITREYCHSRLLGSHAPYPFEAWPEGNRAQLAGESLLFARAITEGLCGLRAVGWKQLAVAPRLSDDCPWLRLRGLRLFGLEFDLQATGEGITLRCGKSSFCTTGGQAVFDFITMRFITENPA